MKRDELAEALRQNEHWRQFLYAASHDLQEPLRAIASYAQMLNRQLENDPAGQEYAAFILDGAGRMKELLQHMMIYARAGTAERRAPLKLNLPLERALLKLAPQLQAGEACVERAALPEAVADEGEMAQVFENILSNALKFRGSVAPRIAISAEQGSDELTLTVRDNGPGIDPRFCEQVLLPFKRLHGKEVPGHGLGLAICEKILRAHHGRIWVESDGQNGAAVRFTLPA